MKKAFFILLLTLSYFCCFSQTIRIVGKNYLIDSSVIFQNKNLKTFSDDISRAHFGSFETKRKIPRYILRFLKKVTGSNFKIANPNQNWQWGCINTGLPKRQLRQIWNSDSLCIITYFTGGKGIAHRILIFKFNGKKITDFWCGYFNEINSISDVEKFLIDYSLNPSQRWALK
ncbi:MAG: hypothetical protein RL708_1720 [Bacteroidota bacterium]|jgi:hypothetical protein